MALAMPKVKSSGDFKTLISRFTIPIELLDDIIYCQRSLRLYMRVHQILAGRSEKLKTKQVEEIESDISDIGREQNALIARLRSTLELYYISIRSDSVEIDREMGNAYVSRILSQYIESGSTIVTPRLVKKRMNEFQLLSHYSLHDTKRKSDGKVENCKSASTVTSLKQESLLKPKSERFAQQKANPNTYPYVKSEVKIENDASLSAASLNNSRMNLLQALNKAKNQSLYPTKSPLSPSETIDNKETIEISSSQSSSSDDTSDIALMSPLYSEDEAEMSQEFFLRKFGLYTIEYSDYLTQKRSQRRRRNVQSNEKSDYHYGKLDMFERMSKRKKTYLHSPPAPRPAKRRRKNKDSDGTASKSSTTDRSSSSSPDQKFTCCECNKTDNLRKCNSCTNWYHIKCHKNAPKLTAKKICLLCFVKLKEAKALKETKSVKDIKEGNGGKGTNDVADLGVAPLDG